MVLARKCPLPVAVRDSIYFFLHGCYHSSNGSYVLRFFFLLGVSFSLIAAIAVDRLFAVSLHLIYREFVTEKRVTFGLTDLWFSN